MLSLLSLLPTPFTNKTNLLPWLSSFLSATRNDLVPWWDFAVYWIVVQAVIFVGSSFQANGMAESWQIWVPVQLLNLGYSVHIAIESSRTERRGKDDEFQPSFHNGGRGGGNNDNDNDGGGDGGKDIDSDKKHKEGGAGGGGAGGAGEEEEEEEKEKEKEEDEAAALVNAKQRELFAYSLVVLSVILTAFGIQTSISLRSYQFCEVFTIFTVPSLAMLVWAVTLPQRCSQVPLLLIVLIVMPVGCFFSFRAKRDRTQISLQGTTH